jgi:sigma-B regulation protein RsbU (phosphoserine phosphatase)
MPTPSKLDPAFQYRLLREISQKIGRTFDLRETLNHLLESLRSAVEYDAAGIFVVNRSVPFGGGPQGHLISGMATIGFDRPAEDDPMLRFGKGVVGHVIRTGETLVVPDVRLDQRYEEGRKASASELAVPIISGGQVIGALDLESDRLAAFTPADAELVEFFSIISGLAIEKAVLHREVLEKERIEHQLAVAREVQAGLLPSTPPSLPGWDLAAVNIPTLAIGGDYYDYIPLSGGRLGVVVADVSGKGIPAALIMATFRATLRKEVRKRARIRGVVDQVNQALLGAHGTSRFVTLVYGVLDPLTGSFTYLNCGHNPPLLLRASGELEILSRGGTALGLFAEMSLDPATVALRAGDQLVFYTDGVTDAGDGSDSAFGVERLEGILRGCGRQRAEDVIRTVVEATRSFTGREHYDDDFTLVVVKRERATPVR